MSLDAKGLEAAAKALEKSSGDSEECCPEIGGCGGTHTDCWYRSRAADTIRAYSAAVLPPDESEAAKAVAAGRAAATPDPPDMTNMCEGESPDHKPGITPAASPDERPTREAIEALPRWIAVEQAGYDANVNGPGPVMHAAVLLDDVLGLLAAPSHRGDEAAGTPAAVLNTEPSSGAASPDERLREALRDANEYLAQIADYSPSEVADAIDSVRAQIKDALAVTDSRGKPDGASVPDQSCATCGGSGDRNGNRRAADPFGTCPGCGGTGKVAAADREAPDGPRCNCVQYIEGDVTYHASGCPRAPVSDEPKLRRDTGGEAADFLGGYPPVPDETEES